MKNLTSIGLLILATASTALGQTTVTTPDGRKTTASCDRQGDCAVWDSTNELSILERRHLLKEQKQFCKAKGISDKTVKAWDSNTQLGGQNINRDCYSEWSTSPDGFDKWLSEPRVKK
jgi:hypothetical protein